MQAGEPGEFGEALAGLTRAYGEAAKTATAESDAQKAFEYTTRLADAVREMADAAADLRAVMAARIWEGEKLSLAGLAGRIGVSKARADQLVQRAKKAREQAAIEAGESRADV